MTFFHNTIIKNYVLLLFFILVGCKLQEPLKPHGIIFLENRANKLLINKSNKNDIVKIMGNPQIIEEKNEQTWIYIERILTKGKYHKLGKHILKTNNTLVLSFDKYGVLETKQIYKKEDVQKILFSKKTTTNEMTKKSFVESFLSSVRSKMYRNRK